MTTFVTRGKKSQIKSSQAFKHSLDQMPTSELVYLPLRTKRTESSASHLEKLCLSLASGHTYVPCDFLSSTDVWVCLETLKSHP